MPPRTDYVKGRALFVLGRTDWNAYRSALANAPATVIEIEQRLTTKLMWDWKPWIVNLADPEV